MLTLLACGQPGKKRKDKTFLISTFDMGYPLTFKKPKLPKQQML